MGERGLWPVDAAPPPLGISVDNGRESSASGDRLRYIVTLTNQGAADIKDLVITQTVPAGLTFVSADGRGVRGRQVVTWEFDLTAATRSTVHTVMMRVASPPDTVPGLATHVCAQLTAEVQPVVCHSDSDLLPAGAAAAAARLDPMTWSEGHQRRALIGDRRRTGDRLRPRCSAAFPKATR